MKSFQELRSFASSLPENGVEMPVLFIGHGSPMNGIEDNAFSKRWKEMGQKIPLPSAVIVVSAHWFTRGTKITAMDFPKTIHDFGGFPDALYQVQYPAPGNPLLARDVAEMVRSVQVELDHDWGLDHGTWTIVRNMYPDAKIPVLQLSIDYTKGGDFHYALAAEMQSLRKKGVLIIGSGNMVHNLRMVDWSKLNEPGFGYEWAHEMNFRFKELILKGLHDELVHYDRLGKAALLAIPTPEHYLPLVYSLGVSRSADNIEIFNDTALGGSLTMTSVKWG
ncbi:MAG: hypothetical protein RLZ76_139 [Bacteroidota bacterium]|jgi:4,5-DOPA dioxygenase extradiol